MNTIAKALIFSIIFIHFNSSAAFTEQEQNSLDTYQQFLDSLDQTDISSISKASAQYILTVAPDTQAVKDEAFLFFLKFYTESSKALWAFLQDPERVFAWVKITEEPKRRTCELNSGGARTFDLHPNGFAQSGSLTAAIWRMSEEPTLAALLKRNGFSWVGDEGYWYTFHTPDFVTDIFLPHISDSLKEYILLRSLEVPNLYCADGSLTLSSTELVRRVLAWENYLTDFPDSLLHSDAVYLYRAYLGTFLFLDNYRQPESDESEYPREWKQYIEDNPERKSAEFVKEYYLLQKDSLYKPDESDISEFQNKLEKYFDSLGEGPSQMKWIHGVYLPTLLD